MPLLFKLCQYLKNPLNIFFFSTANLIQTTNTRGIWKVLSMVFYLSNRFKNPIIFGIILKSYISSMLWDNCHEDIIIQTRKNIIVNTCTACILENATFQWKI